MGSGRANDIGCAVSHCECGVRCNRYTLALGAVQTGQSYGGHASRKIEIAEKGTNRMEPENEPLASYVSSAFRRENVAVAGTPEEIDKIVAAGVPGAMAVAGLAVAVVLTIWFAFFLFIYLPRGAVG